MINTLQLVARKIFIVQCFFSNRERLGPVRHTRQLAQKVYKCVNMFLETGSVLRKKDSRRPRKRSTENIEEGEQRIIAVINPRN
jgi:hypothetical protein